MNCRLTEKPARRSEYEEPGRRLSRNGTHGRPIAAGSLDFCQFFFQQLFVVQVGIVSVQGEQFVVRAPLHDAPAMQHGDHVRVAHGGDTVRDEDGGPTCHEIAQMVENLVFGVRIHAGKCVVQHQNPGIADERPGNRGPLLLPAG